MAQPPLSQQIRQLEAELGVTLLSRTTRRVDLTPAGAAYLERAGGDPAAADDAAEEAQRVAGGTGRLAIGCVGSATYSLLPGLARTLRDELPDIDFGVPGEMLAPARAAALLRRRDRPRADAPARRGLRGIALETLRRDRLLVALPDGHPLAARTNCG